VFDRMRVLLVDIFTPVECVPFGVGSRYFHWLNGYWWGGGAWCGHAVTPACSLACSNGCEIYHRTLAEETNGCFGRDTETPTRTCPTPLRMGHAERAGSLLLDGIEVVIHGLLDHGTQGGVIAGGYRPESVS
jgi:hypothetical protein